MEATANFHGGELGLASMKVNPTSMEEANTAFMEKKQNLPWKLPSTYMRYTYIYFHAVCKLPPKQMNFHLLPSLPTVIPPGPDTILLSPTNRRRPTARVGPIIMRVLEAFTCTVNTNSSVTSYVFPFVLSTKFHGGS